MQTESLIVIGAYTSDVTRTSCVQVRASPLNRLNGVKNNKYHTSIILLETTYREQHEICGTFLTYFTISSSLEDQSHRYQDKIYHSM